LEKFQDSFQNQLDAHEFLKKGIVSNKNAMVIQGSGVDTNFFNRKKVKREEVEKLRQELGLLPNQMVITMISRLLRSKGVLEFSEASKILKRNYSNLQFLLIGSEDPNSIDSVSREEIISISKEVKWIGERHDIRTILAVSEIFTLPSFYREGIPRVLLEAASMGLPLVAARSPGSIEVVKDSENGFIVPPRDSSTLAKAIEVLVQNELIRKKFGEVSRQFSVSIFDLSIISNKIISLYENLLCQKEISTNS